MRKFFLLFFSATLAGSVVASDAPAAPMAPKVPDPIAIAAAVQQLGDINGVALACGQKEIVTRAKTLMIMRVPKTREYGEIFEKATNDGFLAQSVSRQPCPHRATATAQLETAARPLPAAPSHQAITETAAPAVGVNPRYLLQDTNGRAFMDSDYHGRFQLITFGYTFCPDICPTTLIEMAEVLKQLGADAARLQPIFVSVDPERDTLDVLRTYTGFFDNRILGATATPELLRRTAENFKVRYEKVSEPGAAPLQYAVDHSAGMYLLGPRGEFITKFGYATPVADVAARIRAYIAQAPLAPAGQGAPSR